MGKLTIAVALLGAVACAPLSQRRFDPRYVEPLAADVTAEVTALATELTRRAEERAPLGSARVVVDDLVALAPRAPRFRQVVLERRETANTEATLRHELEMALAPHVNVVGGTRLSGLRAEALAERARACGATHAVVGTFQRHGDDLEVALQLLDLRSDWLVATARRRIVRFEPDDFGAEGRGRREPRRVASHEPDAGGVAEVPEPVVSLGVVEGGEESSPRIPEDFVWTPENGPAAARLYASGPAVVDGPARQGSDPGEASADERSPD